MKILVIVDVHGSHEILAKTINKIKEKFDLIVCAGDLTDMFNIPSEFSQLDIANLVLQKMVAFNKPTFCIPGNHDPYEILDIFNDFGVNLHDKLKTFEGYDFLGFGGARTPFHTIFEPSEDEIRDSLKKHEKEIKNPLVFISHAPPVNTKTDQLYSGQHAGSVAIREFIEKKKPLLVLTGHIHEAVGLDKIGETQIFNPGPAYDGYYGIVELNGKQVKCESKRIKI